MLVLVDRAAPARLRELVLRLLPEHPDVDLVDSFRDLEGAPVGSTLILRPRLEEADWMNLRRPLVADRRLRLVIWGEDDTAAGLARLAPDFFDWISHRAECPPAVPAHATCGLRAAVRARALGIVWDGGPAEEVLRAALPRRRLRLVPASLPYQQLISAVEEAGADWPCFVDVDREARLRRVRWSLAEAGRRRMSLLAGTALRAVGWWSLHDRVAPVSEAVARLRRAGARGRLAALVGLEPEALDLAEQLLGAGEAPHALETAAAEASDPGAALAARAADRGLLDLSEVVRGAAPPPVLRGLARNPGARELADALDRSVVEQALRSGVVSASDAGAVAARGWVAVPQEALARAIGQASSYLGEAALRRRPRDAATWRTLADGALAAGDPDVADRWIQRARALSPADPDVLQTAARVAGALGSFAEAERLSRQAGPARAEATARPWLVPFERNPYFTGREEVLHALHEALDRQQAAVIGQSISGLGGIGKTQTAVEYAYRHRDEHSAVFFVRADSELSVRLGYAEIARVLRLPEREAEKSDEIVEAVLRWLTRHEGWLLILDNADEPAKLKGLLPRAGRGHLLVTSRAHELQAVGVRSPHPLGEMAPGEALEFLLRRTGREAAGAEERAAAAELATELGHLPLALEQAGAFLVAQQASFADYLKSYRKNRLLLLGRARPVTGNYPESVATTWAMNFQEVEALSRAAADVLLASAFLDPYAIPLELLAEGAAELGPMLAEKLKEVTEDPLLLDAVLEPLLRYSLIRRDVEARTYGIHRLVQEVVKDGMDEEARQTWAERVVRAVARVFPEVEFATWPRCARLLAHAQVAARLMAERDLMVPEGALLVMRAGKYQSSQGQFREAERLHRQALELVRHLWGEESQATAAALTWVAEACLEQGKHQEAVPLLDRALTVYRAQGPAREAGMDATLVQMARLHQVQGNLERASSLLRQAISIREATFGPDAPRTISAQQRLALVLRLQGRFAEAEQLCERALQLYGRRFSPEHPHVVEARNMLATIYYDQGRYGEAIALVRQAVSTAERSLGVDHPFTASVLVNLSAMLEKQGDFDEAEQMMRRALVIQERTLGPEHPATAQSLANLAVLYAGQKRWADAEPLLCRAIEIQRAANGEESPAVAVTLRNLGTAAKFQGRPNEAERQLREALRILRKTVGMVYPYASSTAIALADLLVRQRRYKEAEPLCKEALRATEQSLGPDHPEIITPLRLLGAVHRARDRSQKAASLERRAQAIEKKAKGAAPPRSAAHGANLGLTIWPVGRRR